MIKSFKLFNEAATHKNIEQDFKYIFIDFIDDGCEFKIENKFFDKEGFPNSYINSEHYRIGYDISIGKYADDEDGTSIDINYVKKIIESIEECRDRLTEYGEVSIEGISFNHYMKVEFYVIEKDSVGEVSDKDGFYDFVGNIKRKFEQSYNDIKRAFNIESDNKENIIFKPKNPEFNSKSLLAVVKNFVNNTTFKRNKIQVYRPGGYSYEYDIKLVNNEIHVQYKGRTHHPQPVAVQNEDDD